MRPLSSLMVALWFALYVGAPQLLHPCPQHAVGGLWGSATNASHHAATNSAQAHAHAGSSTPVTSASNTHDASPTGDAPAPAGEHDCCCPGPQCGSSAIPVAIATSWVSVSIVEASVKIAAPPLLPTFVRVAYTLPYATAPPATARA